MIRWTQKASLQFQAIHKYIALDSLEAARNQCALIVNAINQLNTFPKLGKPGRSANVRHLTVSGTRYIVTYKLKGSVVLLQGIRHGAQRPLNR